MARREEKDKRKNRLFSYRGPAVLIIVVLTVCSASLLFVSEDSDAYIVDSGSCGTSLTWQLDSNGSMTISGSGSMDNYYSYWNTPWSSYCGSIRTVTINTGVTNVGDYAFDNCTSLTSVSFPYYGMTSIGIGAFRSCHSLTSVSIPYGVTSIGIQAFYRCSSLASIFIPDSVTSIGDLAFTGCTNLSYFSVSSTNPNYCSSDSVLFDKGMTTLIQYPAKKTSSSYTVPNSVTTIGTYSFLNCLYLDSLTMPDSVTTIEGDAFLGASIKSVTIGSGVNNILIMTFSSCPSLTTITVSGSNPWYSSVDGVLFDKSGSTLIVYPCAKSSAKYDIPNGVTSINAYAFSRCHSLTSVTIPNGVTLIGYYAFYDCSSLTSVTIPNSVTAIGDYAFYDCSSLTSVTIPNSVTSIGQYAFYDCSSLTSVTIPNGITAIGRSVFYGCSSLTSVTIPDSATSIGQYAFCDCSSLTSVTIPYSVTIIENFAFYNCSSLTSVSIGSGVTTIEDYAFRSCRSLVSLSIGSGVTSIGDHAFENCPSLASITVSGDNPNYSSEAGVFFDKSKTKLIVYPACKDSSTYSIPATVVTIGDYAFNYSRCLTSVTIPDSVTSIGQSAFYGCSSLTSVTIPNSVTSIGYNAFYDCSSIVSVSIGSGVTSIGTNAFQYCTSLTSITVSDDNPNYSSADGVLFNKSGTSLIIYPASRAQSAYVIPNTVKVIRDYAFSYNRCLTSVTIPNGVTSIGYDAFYGCSSIALVSIGSGVTSIGDYAFENCPSLVSITVSGDNTNYSSEDGVLFDKSKTVLILYPACKTQSTYSTPSTVVTIQNSAFSNNKYLTSLTISGSVTSIGRSVFYGCSSLTSVTIPNSVTSIDNDAFCGCSSLTSVTIPNSVTSIGQSAFSGCSSLTSVTIPNSVKSIGQSAFSGCSSLSSVSIGSGVTSIGNTAFTGCTSLTSISVSGNNLNYSSSDGVLFDKNKKTLILYPVGKGSSTYSIPYTVTAISDGAFYGCKFLTSVTIPNSVESIGSQAFYDSKSLKSINIGSGTTSIGYYAFRISNALESISVSSDNPNYCSADGVLFDKDKTMLIHYPACKTSTVYIIPDTVRTIRDGAFFGCTFLKSVIIPNGVTDIESYTFYSSTSLTSVNIPDSVTSIGNYAFYGCSSLTSLNIPAGVTDIGTDAFCWCPSLTSIDVSGDNLNYSSVDGVFFDKNKTKLIMYPACKDSSTYAIPDTVTSINYSAFFGCKNLTSVTIPDGVKSIGAYAFFDCTSLKSVTIPNTVTDIGQYAFYNCTSLTSVNITASVTTIDPMAFSNCTSLEAFTVSADNPNYCSVDGVLFNKSKTALVCYPAGKTSKSYDIPGTVESIEGYAFYGNSHLTSVTIGSQVEDISEYTFIFFDHLTAINVDSMNENYCSVDGVLFNKSKTVLIQYPAGKGSTTYTIPNTVTSLGSVAFFMNSKLITVNIPDSVEVIGNSTFYGCTSLEKINVGKDNTRYSSADGILYDKSGTKLICCPGGLKTFRVPVNVTSTNSDAFTGNLEELTFVKDSDVNVTTGSFTLANNLKRIVIEEGAKVIFLQSSFAFLDADKHTIYVSAPEGFVMPGYVPYGYVEFIYGEPPGKSKVTYRLDDEIVAEYLFRCGTEVTVLDTYEKAGYEVSAWTSKDVTVAGGKFKIGVSDVTFTATSQMIVNKGDSGSYYVTADDTAAFTPASISEILESAKADKTVTMTATIGGGRIVFDNASLRTLKNSAADLSMRKVETPEPLKDRIGGRPTFDISFGDNVDFGKGMLMITVPYELGGGEDAGKLVIYHVKDGKIAETIECTYANGYITFFTNHLSMYSVGYEGSSEFPIWYAAVGVVVAAAAIAGAVILLRRRSGGSAE